MPPCDHSSEHHARRGAKRVWQASCERRGAAVWMPLTSLTGAVPGFQRHQGGLLATIRLVSSAPGSTRPSNGSSPPKRVGHDREVTETLVLTPRWGLGFRVFIGAGCAPERRRVDSSADACPQRRLRLRAQRTPFPGSESIQRKSADVASMQRLNVVSRRREHPPYLVVAAFVQGQARALRRKHLQFGGQ